MDLAHQVQQEIIRLKSVESTLDMIHQSAKKQLGQYLSSNSKSKTTPSGKQNGNIQNLNEVKVNLMEQFDKVKNNTILEMKQHQQYNKQSKQLRQDIDKLKQFNKELNQQKKKTNKKQTKDQAKHKLYYEMQLLRKLQSLQRHLKRYGLKE